ncbi:MAG: thymidine phosphorylase, partial [Actinobacteria bacterium]|nr:thymidine phosphorylase [Actinomycetota bacterium]
SIMSKKIAEGTSALILDVKTGSGAFISDPEQAKLLARTMVDLGVRAGVKTRALVTAMDVPLGLTAGNALEVRESIEVLAGGGPSDVVELTLLLAREMLELVGVKGKDPAVALKDGSAMDHWRRMIKAQDGDPDAKLPTATESEVVLAESDGLVTEMDALKVGLSAWLLGAGRSRQGEKVQAGAGIEMHAKPGEIVKKGVPLFTLHTDEPERFPRSLAALAGAVSISASNQKVERLPLIVARID